MAFFVTSHKMQESAAALQVDPPTTQKVIAVASGSRILVATVARTSQDVSLSELAVCGDSSSVQCAALSHSGCHLCASTDNKNLAIWHQSMEGGMSGWSPGGTRVLPKRPMALCFTADEKWILIGDKAGEVYRYPVDDIVQAPGWHVLGHFSMLLDMVLLPSNSHLITCDRDEKIRVSKFPNSYNIETFCLAHTEFVSSLCVCPANQEILLSGSGDGTVKAWHWREGRLLDSWEVGRDEDDGTRGVVVKVCCSSHDLPIVVVALERKATNSIATFDVFETS